MSNEESMIINYMPTKDLENYENYEKLGKALAESIMNIINMPVRPGSVRSIVGEDKSNRKYDFPRLLYLNRKPK